MKFLNYIFTFFSILPVVASNNYLEMPMPLLANQPTSATVSSALNRFNIENRSIVDILEANRHKLTESFFETYEKMLPKKNSFCFYDPAHPLATLALIDSKYYTPEFASAAKRLMQDIYKGPIKCYFNWSILKQLEKIEPAEYDTFLDFLKQFDNYRDRGEFGWLIQSTVKMDPFYWNNDFAVDIKLAMKGKRISQLPATIEFLKRTKYS